VERFTRTRNATPLTHTRNAAATKNKQTSPLKHCTQTVVVCVCVWVVCVYTLMCVCVSKCKCKLRERKIYFDSTQILSVFSIPFQLRMRVWKIIKTKNIWLLNTHTASCTRVFTRDTLNSAPANLFAFCRHIQKKMRKYLKQINLTITNTCARAQSEHTIDRFYTLIIIARDPATREQPDKKKKNTLR
jgi:uncharacterized membrane protein YgcG